MGVRRRTLKEDNMQPGLSLRELAGKIAGIRDLKHDLIADTRQLSVRADEDGRVALLDRGTDNFYPILRTAHDQIGARLAIPAKYYRRMEEEDPTLLGININAWFQRAPERRMLRTLGGDLRAFLSDRYQRIENEEIVNAALPVLMNIPDVKIVSSEVTERRMYIQATTPRITREVKKGDAVQAGVIISNSEIGHGAVSVRPMIYRLVCLNGMVAGEGLRSYHTGRRVSDSEELWADDTRAADDRAVLLKVRDMVAAAVDDVKFGNAVERMQALATGAGITGNPVKATEVLAQKLDLSQDEQGGLLRALLTGGDLSGWGVINAVTAQAHEAVSYDRSVEFEAMGGKLLEMSRHEWKEVLDAA
jgi:hypothetical protein